MWVKYFDKNSIKVIWRNPQQELAKEQMVGKFDLIFKTNMKYTQKIICMFLFATFHQHLSSVELAEAG